MFTLVENPFVSPVHKSNNYICFVAELAFLLSNVSLEAKCSKQSAKCSVVVVFFFFEKLVIYNNYLNTLLQLQGNQFDASLLYKRIYNCARSKETSSRRIKSIERI